MYNLENKVAIVTGGGSGIGQTIALRLADEGAHVVIIGRTEKSLKETAEKHENISYVVPDITKTADLERLFSEVKVKFGRLDILVNNAGVAPVTPLEKPENGGIRQYFQHQCARHRGCRQTGSPLVESKPRNNHQHILVGQSASHG